MDLNSSRTSSPDIAKDLVKSLFEKVTVLLDASMLFLANDCVEVMILEHKAAECVEVIAFSPFLNVEAPRMYLDLNLINQKIENITQHKSENPDDQKYLVADEYLTSYITTRLMVLGGSDNISKFTIHLVPTCESDIVVDQRHCRMDIEYTSKPKVCIPFDTYRPRTTL
jgi:hypothetical protein